MDRDELKTAMRAVGKAVSEEMLDKMVRARASFPPRPLSDDRSDLWWWRWCECLRAPLISFSDFARACAAIVVLRICAGASG